MVEVQDDSLEETTDPLSDEEEDDEEEVGTLPPPPRPILKTGGPSAELLCERPTGAHSVPAATGCWAVHSPEAQRWYAVVRQYQSPSSAQAVPTGKGSAAARGRGRLPSMALMSIARLGREVERVEMFCGSAASAMLSRRKIAMRAFIVFGLSVIDDGKNGEKRKWFGRYVEREFWRIADGKTELLKVSQNATDVPKLLPGGWK